MDEQQQPSTSQNVSSFTTRMTNIFTSPSELYTEVAASPVQTTSWLIPMLTSIILGIVFTFVLYNNPSLRQQIYDIQASGLQKAVEEGKMTQERADEMRDRMESSGSTMFMLFGAGGAIVSIAAMFFIGSLALWLAAKIALKFGGSWGKILEMFGLTWLIGVLGTIITLIMVNLFTSMYATPSGSLLVMNGFDIANKGHRLLSSLNIFTIWQTALVGIGLSKLSGKSAGIGMSVAFGLWLLWVVITVVTGFGRM